MNFTVCLALTSVIRLLFSTKFSLNLYWPSFNISDPSVILHHIFNEFILSALSSIGDLSTILHQSFNEFILSALLLHQWSVCFSQPNYQWFYSVCLASASVICLLFSTKFSMNLYCLSCFYISYLSVFLHQIFNEYILSGLRLHYSPSHFQWIYTLCLALTSVIRLLFSTKFSMHLYCLPCFYISDLSVILHQIFNEFILSA